MRGGGGRQQYGWWQCALEEIVMVVGNLIALWEDQHFFALLPMGSAFHVRFLVLTEDLRPIYHNREVSQKSGIRRISRIHLRMVFMSYLPLQFGIYYKALCCSHFLDRRHRGMVGVDQG